MWAKHILRLFMLQERWHPEHVLESYRNVATRMRLWGARRSFNKIILDSNNQGEEKKKGEKKRKIEKKRKNGNERKNA